MDDDTLLDIHGQAAGAQWMLGDLRALNGALSEIAEALASITVAGLTLVTAPSEGRTGIAADIIEATGVGMRSLEVAQASVLGCVELLHGRALLLKDVIAAAEERGDLG